MLTTAYATGTTTAIFPSKGVHATCIDCKEEVISKCGPINADHFAHRPGVVCNTRFHDNKTAWHINWQHTIEPALPGINVEVPVEKEGCIKRADLISKSNYVVEFQHSHLPKDERIEREKHYRNIIWVVHTDRKNSKTWMYPTFGVRTFFNGDDNTVHWKALTHNRKLHTFSISKERFIKTVINNPYYTDSIFNTIEARQQNSLYDTIEYYNRKSDEHDTIQLNRNTYLLRSDYYVAVLYLINEFVKIEKYHAELKADRLETKRKYIEQEYTRLKQIRETTAALLKEQKRIKDPALLQAIQKTELDCIEDTYITERNNWVQFTELELLKDNRARYEAKLKLEREREAEIAKQINTEIINNRINQLSKETQERIRIDLIRANGRLEYAAEIARKKLKELGIDYNDETTRVAYGVGTQ
jgi:hypothetical protein